MPAKYSKKGKRGSKKPYKKKRASRTFRPQRLLTVGFPKTTMVKLRYCDTFTLNPGVGAVSQYFYRANSPFDPDYTGTGHQPMNFDQWSLLYNHYVVVGAKITVVLNPTETSTAIPAFWGVNLADDTTVSTDAITLMEQGLTKYRNITTNHFQMLNPKAITISKGFSCKRFFNITNPTDNLSRLGAPITASPTDTALWCIFYGSLPTLGSDTPSMTFTVKIDYVVIFSEPKEQPTS